MTITMAFKELTLTKSVPCQLSLPMTGTRLLVLVFFIIYKQKVLINVCFVLSVAPKKTLPRNGWQNESSSEEAQFMGNYKNDGTSGEFDGFQYKHTQLMQSV